MPHFNKYILLIIVIVSIMLGACEKQDLTKPIYAPKDSTSKDTIIIDTVIKDTVIPITKSFFEAEIDESFYEKIVYKEGSEDSFTYSEKDTVLRLHVGCASKIVKSIGISITIDKYYNKIGTYKGPWSYYSQIHLENRKVNNNAYGSWGQDTSYVKITKNDDKTIEGKFYICYVALSSNPISSLIAKGSFGFLKK